MNRKYVLKNRRRFYIFIMVMSILLTCIFFSANVNGEDTKPAYTTITIEKGDTLWDLAKEYCKGGDIRNYIHKIQKLNGLTDGVIFEGDTIKIPV